MASKPQAAGPALVAVVAARNEGDRIGATLDALAESLPEVELVVADDASEDATAEVARARGARVVTRAKPLGKGGNMSAAAADAFERVSSGEKLLLLVCDGDLGASARQLPALLEPVAAGECDLAIAGFRRRVGGGFGVALSYAHRAIQRLCGYDATAPISGQRVLSAAAFRACYPFACGYGMEIGMTVDVVRAGLGVREVELDLEHRATGRTLAGFTHRARQLRDFRQVYTDRRGRS